MTMMSKAIAQWPGKKPDVTTENNRNAEWMMLMMMKKKRKRKEKKPSEMVKIAICNEGDGREKRVTLLMNRDVNGKLVACREERGLQNDRWR